MPDEWPTFYATLYDVYKSLVAKKDLKTANVENYADSSDGIDDEEFEDDLLQKIVIPS